MKIDDLLTLEQNKVLNWLHDNKEDYELINSNELKHIKFKYDQLKITFEHKMRLLDSCESAIQERDKKEYERLNLTT